MSFLRKVVCLFAVAFLLFADVAEGQGARYVERQLLCVLDKAPCDAWGSQVKSALPEIIGNGCQACDNVQLNNVRRITRFIQTRYPGLWSEIVQKYSTS